tara:strand:+ start:194 stop:589 length:396 start_codon:yes stop_codon:yes gene_type:complete
MAQIPGIQYTFDTQINSLLQIGDNAYFLSFVDPNMTGINVIQTETENGSADGISLGKVVEIGTGFIKCDNQLSQGQLDFINITPGFVVFEKNAKVNESGLKGYYADVELRNFSNKKAELFYVNSEVTYSSK